MNLYSRIFSMLLMAVMWNACSDSGESVVNAAATVTSVEKYDDLPDCDDGRNGLEYYVSSENSVYACVDSKWRLTAKVKDVNTFVPLVCSTKSLKDSSGVQIICGDSVVTQILNGTEGAKGDTGDKGQTGANGTNGATGNKGATGAKGDTGDKGAAGKNGSNGTNGKNGEPGDDCTAIPLDDNSGLKIVCGNDSVAVILNGRNGEKGPKGRDCSVRINDGSVTQICDGYENTLSDGTDITTLYNRKCQLETMVSGGLKVVCDGDSLGVILSGINGKKGRNGVDGKNCTVKENEDGSGWMFTCDGTLASDIQKASWTNLNPDIEYDYFIDNRDRQIYKMVKIGSQVWMAENLNYADSVKTPSLKGKNWCYDNLDTCAKYGRSYSWAAVMDSVNTGCGFPKSCTVTYPVQGICPDGWHVPDTLEWKKLFDYVGGSGNAGVMLKSKNDWTYYTSSTKGIDKYGFSIAPAGYFESNWFNNKNTSSYLWSSVEVDPDYAYYVYADYSNTYMNESSDRKFYGRSLRCIKNDSLMNKSQVLNGRQGKNCSAIALEDGSGYKISCGDVPAQYVEKLSWQFLNPDVKYEAFVDERDNQIYKMVKIGDQVWMAENLNYADSVKTPSLVGKTACYPDNSSQDSCKKYGRNYTWAAMMDSVNTGCGYGKYCSPTYPVQGICPNGWHLPTRTEWNTLMSYVSDNGYSTGYALNSKMFYMGSDDYGFSSIPVGYWYYSGSDIYFSESGYAYIWTSTQEGYDYAYYRSWYYGSSGFDETYSDKYRGQSVRCIKNDTSFVSSSFLGNGKDGTNGENGSSCITKPSLDGSISTIVCGDDILGTVINGSEGTYCAEVPLWDGSKETSLRCGLKKGVTDYGKISWRSLNPAINYGEFVDDRDGQPYKTVKIGTQTWFAENLNYADSVKTPVLKGRSWCYNNNRDNCLEYGRLYTWGAVMDSVKTGCGYDKSCSPTYPVRGICPMGWHVPTRDEWNTLFETVGGTGYAGVELKSFSSDWYYYDSYTKGKDEYGFSVRPAGYGYRDYSLYYNELGYVSRFWSSSENYSSDAYLMYTSYSGTDMYDSWNSKYYAYSVRCIKD